MQRYQQQQRLVFDPTDTIFIGGLPLSATDNEVRAFFEQFGSLQLAMVKRKSEDDPENLGYGFLIVADQASMRNILSRKFYKFKERKVEVSRYVKKGEKRNTKLLQKHLKSLYVDGFPVSVNEVEARRFFSGFGTLQNLYLLKVEQGSDTRQCFVLFRSKKTARRVEDLGARGKLVFGQGLLSTQRGNLNIPKEATSEGNSAGSAPRRQFGATVESEQFSRQSGNRLPKSNQSRSRMIQASSQNSILDLDNHGIDQNSDTKKSPLWRS